MEGDGGHASSMRLEGEENIAAVVSLIEGRGVAAWAAQLMPGRVGRLKPD